MGRVKIKRKSTLIDMTAMSDVTVLLLTFFMLTSTFLQKEPVTVKTPSSISEQAVPSSNLVTVLVDEKENVFIGIVGAESKPSEDMRKEVLKKAVTMYDKLHKTNIYGQLDESMLASFAALNTFGCPIAKLPELLKQKPDKIDLAMKPGEEGFVGGIPIDGRKTFETAPNEFQIWMQAYREVADATKAKVENADGSTKEDGTVYDLVKQGKVISIKADEATPYSVVHVVMDNLQTMKMNKFTLMTSLKTNDK